MLNFLFTIVLLGGYSFFVIRKCRICDEIVKNGLEYKATILRYERYSLMCTVPLVRFHVDDELIQQEVYGDLPIRFPVGTEVIVHYWKEHPFKAVLDKKDYKDYKSLYRKSLFRLGAFYFVIILVYCIYLR